MGWGVTFKSPNSKILLELNLEVNIPTNPKIQVPLQRDFSPQYLSFRNPFIEFYGDLLIIVPKTRWKIN